MKKNNEERSDVNMNIRGQIKALSLGCECSFEISKRRIVQNYTSDLKALSGNEYRTETRLLNDGVKRIFVTRVG